MSVWLANFGEIKRSFSFTKRILDYENHCTFCSKHKSAVKNFIGLPRKCFICNECVDVLNEMIIEEDSDGKHRIL